MRVLSILLLTFMAAGVSHAAGEQSPVERSRNAIDAAIESARAQQQIHRDNPNPPRGITIESLRQTQGVDPAAIASRYSEMTEISLPAREDLIVFVSTSMPMEGLKRLAEQTAKAGGVMVFRGVAGGLEKGAFARWMQQLQPIAATGVAAQIDPEAFTRFGIEQIPAFVIGLLGDQCRNDQCAANSSSVLAGDVSLDYALDRWIEQSSPFASAARRYLARLDGDDR